ncbi:hypothetical protein CN221_38530 [Sinorhizobium meliloti]|nr:hypothetical protein DA101_019025 [Sinorhizobium meliloti]RMI18535.1 hypothetical protein DA102_023565 [Sinorhizobium meliloti]RVG52726.1 hypothetical protein CN226_14140 [Sinorhizobium meliloti]RVG60287.1 hypothetical protein CN222_26265 [Sinorhizobium meliloti]RVG77052.1 hypothetical protein CN221_38530 [Sinorhizobium meliloti]
MGGEDPRATAGDLIETNKAKVVSMISSIRTRWLGREPRLAVGVWSVVCSKAPANHLQLPSYAMRLDTTRRQMARLFRPGDSTWRAMRRANG